MSSTFDTVANIISETCDIPRETITPESHAINDLGIDSLDFLDIAFAIDKTFGIKMPLEQWTQEVNDGKASAEQYFQLDNLCSRIDELVAAKSASALAAEPAARSGSAAYDCLVTAVTASGGGTCNRCSRAALETIFTPQRDSARRFVSR